MTTNVQPNAEDISTVFQNNNIAAQQLQIVTLTRLLAERDAEIETLKAQNGTGDVAKLEKVT